MEPEIKKLLEKVRRRLIEANANLPKTSLGWSKNDDLIKEIDALIPLEIKIPYPKDYDYDLVYPK